MDFWSIELGVGVLLEAALILLLWMARSFRVFPAFFIYICWGLVSDVGMYGIRADLSPALYLDVYIGQMIVDSVVMFAVLVELAWNLFRPIRPHLPRFAWIGLAGLVALAGCAVWPIASFAMPARVTSLGAFFFHLQQTFAFLRVLIFLGMARFSQMLSIGWRDREMQVATGFGVYSLVSLAVNILHSHQAVGSQYHWLDVLESLSYAMALLYWVICFATREEKRKEFTPQMRSFLLAAASMSRATRMSLQNQRDESRRDGR